MTTPAPPAPPTAGAAGLDLTPRGGAAPPLRRVLGQALFDARVLLSNGEQLLVSIVLPALALLLLVLLPVTLGDLGVPDDLSRLGKVDVVAPGVLAMAVLSTSFTGQAIQLGFDRRYGVLRLMSTTPLGRGGLLAGRVTAVLAVEVVQVIALGAVAAGLGWRPWERGVGALVLLAVALLLGTAAFVAIAVLLAGALRAEAVLALVNLVYVLLLAGGGVLLPVRGLPGPLEALATVLPSGALGELARSAALDGRLELVPVLVLLAWTAGASALVLRTFRWT